MEDANNGKKLGAMSAVADLRNKTSTKNNWVARLWMENIILEGNEYNQVIKYSIPMNFFTKTIVKY